MKWYNFPRVYLLSRLFAHNLQKKIDNPDLIESVKEQLFSFRRHRLDRKEMLKKLITMSFIRKGDTVVEPGAHRGVYTELYASLVGKKGRVWALEVHPRIFGVLKESMKKFPQVTAHHYAVSSVSGKKIPLQLYPEDVDFQASTVEPALIAIGDQRMPNSEIQDVLSIKLDDLEIKNCRFMKVDVEGHEESVLEGATKLLKRDQPIILFEYGFSPGLLEPRTIEMLVAMGYHIYDTEKLTAVPVRENDKETVMDLIAVPKSEVSKIETLFSFLRSALKPRHELV